MHGATLSWSTLVAGLSLSASGYWLAEHVVPRLSDHRGFYRVSHEDRVTLALALRPRHALVVVVDGLRQDAARGAHSVARLRARGRCAITHVGLPSVSRPVYAVISSGVEQERTGVRNNDDSSPARVDSLWDRARAQGLEVEGRSELAWWRELFPRGFDRYVLGSERTNLFAEPLRADLTLIHPVYADEAAHDHGARSREYARAVARADRELGALLDTLDLSRDLVVFTADHGHRSAGGHGGPSPEVTEVLTCFSGRGVRATPSELRADTRDIAPTLAVLLGVGVPRNSCASHDPSALITAMVDPTGVGGGYLDARLAGIATMGAQARASLAALSGDPGGSLEGLRAAGARRQVMRALCAALLSSVAVAAIVQKTLVGEGLRALRWGAMVSCGYLALYRVLSGGLDASSLNRRGFFVRNVLLASVCALALGALCHGVWGGSHSSLRGRVGLLLALTAAANATHIGVYGWPLGFPLPGPGLYFAPFLLASFQAVVGLALVGLAIREK